MTTSAGCAAHPTTTSRSRVPPLPLRAPTAPATTRRLPCGPILGEGKPENQNLGLVFTCGERVALIDMNQDGYFEQALLMRNLLQEFIVDRTKGEGGRGGSGSRPHVTIVGYPEHIFTQSAGFVTAIYMAMQVVARPPGMRARLVGEVGRGNVGDRESSVALCFQRG